MKKREWKGKEEAIKTKDSVKKTPTGAKNKALQSAFVRETARNARQKSESVFNETVEYAQEDLEDTGICGQKDEKQKIGQKIYWRKRKDSRKVGGADEG